MKRMILIAAALFAALALRAETPAAGLVSEYKDIKGARDFVARGIMMKMARVMMKDYSIAPLAHKVEEVSVLRMDKADEAVRQNFLKDMQEVMGQYMYAGKSDTNKGVVDTYVHLDSPETADELVVFNPDICAFYSMKGKFTIEELLEIKQPVDE